MVWALIGAGMLLVAVLASPVTVRILWELEGAEGQVFLEIHYLVWLTYRHRVALRSSGHSKEPVLRVVRRSSPETPDHVRVDADMVRDLVHKAQSVTRQMKNAWPAVTRLLHKITVREYVWRTDIGLLDAPDTAILCGGAWVAMSGLTGLLTHVFKFAQAPSLGVHPLFHRVVFSTRLSCIATLRLGKAIHAGLGLLWLLRRRGAHGRTSDSVADADGYGKS